MTTNKFTLTLLTAAALLLCSCKEGRELPDVQKDSFERHSTGIMFSSELLGRSLKYSILLPEGYTAETEKSYPVVYMLHGYGESSSDWNDKWIEVIKNLESDGLQPMIYVFPDGFNSYYCNRYDGKFPYMDMFVEELVPHIDATYRTIDDRESRAVMGYSMGGFGAMVLPLKHPETFGISVPLSMSFRTDGQYMSESRDGWNNQWGSIFGGKGETGEGRLTDYYKAHCPFYQFTAENLESLSSVKWFFHCGDNEEQLLIANDNLHVQLCDNGYEHEFRIDDGGHSGSYWRKAATETLPWIAHQMKTPGSAWLKAMSEANPGAADLNEDGSFASEAYKSAEQKSGLAIYLAHDSLSASLVSDAISMLCKKGQIFPYMILPCDLSVKSLEEYIAHYEFLYGVGGSRKKSYIIAFGNAGREAWALKENFNAYYFVDADIAEDESTITAEYGCSYYIDITDDGANYRDMNALYRACKSVALEDGTTVEADFEYRMRNGTDDQRTDVLLAAKSMADNLKYN